MMPSRLALLALVCIPWLGSAARADFAVFQEGATAPFVGGAYGGGEDAMLVTNAGTSADQNFGARTNMEVGRFQGGGNLLRHALVRFDVTALAGQFTSIDAVTLRLHVSDEDLLGSEDIQGAGTLELYRVTAANGGWVEGAGVSVSGGDPADIGESTWSQRVQGSEPWAGSEGASTAGVDTEAALLASVAFDAMTTLPGSVLELPFGDLSFLQAWVSGDNPGLLLREANEESGDLVSLVTGDHAEGAFRPELVVEFTPSGDGCGFAPGVLPDGTYLASCQDCSVLETTLVCDCAPVGGGLVATEIDLSRCDTGDDVSNQDGVLRCNVCAGCPGTPSNGCFDAERASLSILEQTPGKEKLKATLRGFDAATSQADFGDPVSGDDTYELCIYDASSDLVGEVSVDRAGEACGSKQKPCWKAKSSKGYTYKDPDASASGVKKISAVSGAAGKGKLQLIGQNNAKKGQDDLPVGVALLLESQDVATLQLLVRDAECFEASLETVKKADGEQFKAKAP